MSRLKGQFNVKALSGETELITFYIFQNELLGRPSRRLLKPDAIPTNFSYNKGAQVSTKRLCSQRREEESKKRKRVEM